MADRVTLDASFAAAGRARAGLGAALDRLVAEADARPRSRRGPARAQPTAAPAPAGSPSRASWPWARSTRRSSTPAVATPATCSSSAGDAFDVHAVAMLLAAGADAVHPWHADRASRATSPVPGGTRSSTPSAAEAQPPRRAGARAAQGAGPDGDQHAGVVSRRPAVRRHRTGRRRSSTAASRPRRGRPAPPRSIGSARRRSPVTRWPPTCQAPSRPRSARTRPWSTRGFARFRADGELHAFAPAVVKATQALAAGHPTGVGPGAALAPAVAEDAIEDQLVAYRAAVARDEPAMVRDLLVAAPRPPGAPGRRRAGRPRSSAASSPRP